LVFSETVGEHGKAPGAIALWEWLGVPTRLAAGLAGQQPDLVNPERHVALVEFGMSYPRACAHHLDVSRVDRSLGTEGIAVAEYTLAHVGDNFNVAVPMQGKLAADRDLIVIPNDQGA
jgi:hypothetical protein